MKKATIYLACMVLVAGSLVYGQEDQTDRATVAFSNPSQTGKVIASVQRGSVLVKGYNGKEVIIQAVTRGKIVSSSKKQQLGKGKAAGMKRISAAGSGLTITEENNVIKVSTDSWKRTIDLTIQVPFNTDLKLGSYNEGKVTVENVSGELEVNNYNGPLFLSNISGTAVASTYNGEIKVSFAKITADTPMSFRTYNGDVDVTFPANFKATARLRSDIGDVYSDFDINIRSAPKKTESDARKKGGKYKITFEKGIFGDINGGGPQFVFQTYHGDIFIRKATK